MTRTQQTAGPNSEQIAWMEKQKLSCARQGVMAMNRPSLYPRGEVSYFDTCRELAHYAASSLSEAPND